MSANDESANNEQHENDLFEEIQRFLSEQSGDQVYEELSRAYGLASSFAERELSDRPEYTRMLRGIEKLVDDVLGTQVTPALRSTIAEFLYLYGLAHYTLLQQAGEDGDDSEDGDRERAARPLIVHDIWFPTDVGVESTEDGYYLHVSDGRVDISIYLGEAPNERGALVDLVDHWEYASANTSPVPGGPDLSGSVPLLAIEMDYAGSELVDAGDHVDVLLFDEKGEPFIRIHARDSDLRAIVDEIQAIGPNGGL